MAKKSVGIVVGSLRKGSFTRSVANYFAEVLPEDYEAKFLEIGQLELYNEDLAGDPPSSWKNFRKEVSDCDNFAFFTPEYNRSFSGALKNALDVASRPYGENKWADKPGVIVSVSPGAIGGFGANHHLRQSMAFLDVYVMQQPEAYIGGIAEAVDDDGKLIDKDIQGFIKTIADEFVKWSQKFD